MGDGSITPITEGIEGFDERSSSTTQTSPSVEATTSQPEHVTDADVSESFNISRAADSMSTPNPDLYDEIGEITPNDAPTPKEFAEQTFSDGMQARRFEAGVHGHEARITDSGTVGGWKTFSSADITTRESLTGIEDVDGGSTAGFMQRAQLREDSQTAATDAFITRYNHNAGGARNPTIENAHSQMGVYAGLDAMGVETPRHAFDTEQKEVIVEGVSRPGYDATTAESHELPQEHADKINPEQFTDVLAANMIMGNVDCNAENLMVGEDGTVVTFDYDFSETFGQLHGDAAERAESWIDNAVSEINSVRSDELDIDAHDIADRAEELATQLDESGMVDRVVAAVGEYDEFFAGESSDMYADSENPISGETDGMAYRVHKHVTNWSNANDDIVVSGL
jgi:hypothetical protein